MLVDARSCAIGAASAATVMGGRPEIVADLDPHPRTAKQSCQTAGQCLAGGSVDLVRLDDVIRLPQAFQRVTAELAERLFADRRQDVDLRSDHVDEAVLAAAIDPVADLARGGVRRASNEVHRGDQVARSSYVQFGHRTTA
jgi:hypothetical protein